jgi:hypothetical protein
MSITLGHIATWKDRQNAADNLDSQGRRRNSDQTPVAGVPLRDIAARQGAELRRHLATGRCTPAETAMRERVDAVRADRKAPTPVARPAVASVGTRPTFKEVDALAATVPVGMYALPRREDATNAAQPTYHFRVHAFRGGHRIVMVTGGVGAFVEIPMKVNWQWVALKKIAADPKAAAIRFGLETGTCGRCGSPLTNAKSREYGLGPDCRKAY